MAQLAEELDAVDGLVLRYCLDVFVQQFVTQTLRIFGFGLPQEGSDVVVERSFPSALEVNEPRFAILYHDVAALEVAVHEGVGRTVKQHVAHLLEVVLQPVFLKFQTGCFQEAVFEVVQVPKHGALVELGLRIAMREVESFRSGKLYGREQTDGLAEQFFFFFREGVGDASLLDGVEEERVAQVFLQVEQLVVRYAEHLRYGQVLLLEVFRHVEERLVFFFRCAVYADEALCAYQSEVAAVGAGSRHLDNFFGFYTGMLLIKFL